MDFIKTFTVERKPRSEAVITGEIPFTELEKERSRAIQHLGKDLQVDGFRKGHIPEKIIVERIGEMSLLYEMAERAIAKIYPETIRTLSLDAIGHPKITITKIAAANPLGFTATVALMPDVTLPNYTLLASEANQKRDTVAVTDEEVEKQIAEIQRQKSAYDTLQNKAAAKEKTEALTLPTPETVTKDKESETLPELTDEYVSTLGHPGQFVSVADFKEKIKEHLTLEKTREATATHRAKITDAIIAGSEIDVPQIMIDAEINQMFAQMEEDLSRAHLTFEDYLAHIKKTREELVTEWTPAAEKRAKLQLILNEIAKKESINADNSQVEEQISHLKQHYPNASEQQVRVYVTSVLQNEAVMQMLEQIPTKK